MRRAQEIIIPENLRAQLREALVFEPDLVRIIQAQDWEPVAERPELHHVTCSLPIPRAMDPETSELRLLEVYLRSTDDSQAEIVRIDGLNPA
jgi:hypothetical protein